MDFSEEEVIEFKTETLDLLEEAEANLLSLENDLLKDHYDVIFRVFHSVKGISGMMNSQFLQKHMHYLESTFVEQKEKLKLNKKETDFFLRGVDIAKDLLYGETEFTFDYEELNDQSTVQVQEDESSSLNIDQFEVKEEVESTTLIKSKALIVDDEPEIVEILTEYLEGSGFEVIGLTDPRLVVERVKEFNPDVVLSDINMPGINGVNLMKEIHKVDKSIPVILISGHVDKNILMESLNDGVFAVIEKPFGFKEVIQTAINASHQYQVKSLFKKTFDILVGQYGSIETFAQKNNINNMPKEFKEEIKSLYALKRKLKIS